ncbi:MAG: transporter substrate-binding domain-containing protein [Actinomycetia bacterium]|nr:transporter substrate-binding domain-containing protein [Actinomycetes bacterium]
MKKWGKSLGVVALAAVLVLALAGCGSSTKSDGATKSADKTAKKYIIGTDTTFAPFEFQDASGKYVGVDIDLLKAVADDQGFTYELKPLGFNAAVAALESGQVDGVIAGMSITTERQKKYDFSDPYYDSGVVMAIKADNTTIHGYGDLKGKTVAVKTGTEGATFAESIKNQYGFKLAYFDDSPTMYEDVKTGNSVACFEDYPVIGYGISQGNGLKMGADMEKGSSYGFATLKAKHPELVEMFNKGLANLKSSGKYQEILDSYISAK